MHPKAFRILLLLIFVMTSVEPLWAAVFAPPKGKTLLMIGQDRTTIDDYVKATKVQPAGVMIYTSIQDLTGLNEPFDNGAGYQDGNYLLRKYPHSAIQIGLYMVGAIEDVVNGKYNANIKRLAFWIKKAKRPVYLRIGYEFDLPNQYAHSENYKAAYWYIVDYLRREQVENVAFVWHACGVLRSREEWLRWYPGDNYVDWFAVSLFTTQQIPAAEEFIALAHSKEKPFMIAESTPQGLYTLRAKSAWYQTMFELIQKHQIEIFCYINSNWDVLPMFRNQNWSDARIEKWPQVKATWLLETAKLNYIHATKELFGSLGWGK